MKHKFFFYLWMTILIIFLISYFIHPDFFTAKSITGFIKSFNNYILLIYVILFILRGFTLIPGTPFVIAGAMLFPDRPVLILFICILCMLFSAFILYYFSEFLGFDNFFRNKYPDKIEKIKNKLNTPKGLLLIILWSFLPFAPTDLICYVSGILRINILTLLLGVLLGELPICYFYIFTFQNFYN